MELANICNLHCSYCFRSDDNLYSSHAEFFPLDLLRRVIGEARAAAQHHADQFHRRRADSSSALCRNARIIGNAGLTVSFVTNGWHFERVWPALQANRAAVSHVAFSLDGVDARRSRSLARQRIVRSFGARVYALLHVELPFAIKIVIRRDLVDQLEQIAIFAARMGAASLNFVHVMPTSNAVAEIRL